MYEVVTMLLCQIMNRGSTRLLDLWVSNLSGQVGCVSYSQSVHSALLVVMLNNMWVILGSLPKGIIMIYGRDLQHYTIFYVHA